MSDRLAALVTEHSGLVIVVSLVVVVLLSAGATSVEQSSSLSQFESDGPEAEALDYVETNFTGGDDDTTTVQVIVRDGDDNVLDRESLLRSLHYQRSLRDDEAVNVTLAENRSVVGVSNAVAIAAVRTGQARDLQAEFGALQRRNESLTERRERLQRDRTTLQERGRRLNATADELAAVLNRTRELQARFVRLNASLEAGNVSETEYERAADRLRADLTATRTEATVDLNATETATFRRAFDRLRDLQSRLTELRLALEADEIDRETFEERAAEVGDDIEQATRLGTEGVLADRFAALDADAERLEERGQELQADAEQLRAEFEALGERRAALRNASTPSLSTQIERLESMNDSAVESVVERLVSRDGGAGGVGDGGRTRELVFRLLPTGYEPGSTEASARTMVITQRTDGGSSVQGPGGPSDRLTDAQQRMRDLAPSGGDEYVVFGFGIVSDEISRSQSDSFLLVGPLALVFVLVTLVIAYRDLLDIVLGFVGIFSVLGITFGAMGWLGIGFNQVLVAVPVLLIGLSIDYAIHIFMRHREQRGSDDPPRGSMGAAIAGVGVALAWVTATTVIGFSSNLISPIGPIRDFGVVSSIGIAGTMLVFGAFVPAMKIELDELLEGVGLDRRKRAFGTGGGVLSRVLSAGAWAARRSPAAVILIALLVTGVAAVGGSQVSTSFEQSDFLASDPPEWTQSLPEPFRPGEYTAKANLEYVNENFRREDSRSQVLIHDRGGGLATPAAMQRLDAVERRAAASPVTFELASGDSDVRGPLGEMRDLRSESERFDRVFAAADTDDDGVPDRDVERVLATFFEVAPERAAGVIHREGGEYRAARVVVTVKGTAGTETVTRETRAMADQARGDGLTATATGSEVVNQVVQDDLLDTVIESLIVSVVAVFLFLMLAYRVTEGSASLGAVTLLPVALSVAWILGTMFVLDQPFNVLTGTITSLTVGLGVAYSIHLSERYMLELRRRGDVHEAMETTLTGTGGALLGSAATTVGGFGTLVVAVFPALQQFGLITGMTIVYAFLAGVLVLPSLLVVWTDYLGPDVDDADTGEDGDGPSMFGGAAEPVPPADGDDDGAGVDDDVDDDGEGSR
ncbi:Patched family protein [Halobacteriales archaeon SW_5_70_135]|nr:MAG: Patched family protein [Halobacteriales archaeon SW_5_70_135]